MTHQFHFYKITNLTNNKGYIGYTGKLHPIQRWKEHQRAADRGNNQVLYDAIRKHGLAVFQFAVLCSLNLTPEEAIQHETTLIIEHNTLVKYGNGYNVRSCANSDDE